MMLDFDELLVSIKNPQIKKYLEESIKSYRVGNYRSAILTVWIATMFDLVKKFEILVDEKEPTARAEWQRLKPKIEEHRNWENELIKAARSVEMISKYEADTLDTLNKTRNRYAHPSFNEVGALFDPTPEEVRYFIRTLYDIVLSQPAQLGAYYVNQLLEKIKTPTFFGANLSASKLILVKDSVIEIIIKINKKQIPRLIKALFTNLTSPINEDHKLNVLCCIVNLWTTQVEIQISDEVLTGWNNYIEDNKLSYSVMEGILSNPEKINNLSKQSQKVLEEFLITNCLEDQECSDSLAKFLTYNNSVLVAKNLLDTVTATPSTKVINQITYYENLVSDKFADVFGEAILKETRNALKKKDGYKVNPPMRVLRRHNIWTIADKYLLEEEAVFASELIDSLHANNFETMYLLENDSAKDIPLKWLELLLDCWLEKLRSNARIEQSFSAYFNYYMGLIECYEEEDGDCVKLEGYRAVAQKSNVAKS